MRRMKQHTLATGLGLALAAGLTVASGAARAGVGDDLLIKTHAGSAGFSLALAAVSNADAPVVFDCPLAQPGEGSAAVLRNAFTKWLTAKTRMNSRS